MRCASVFLVVVLFGTAFASTPCTGNARYKVTFRGEWSASSTVRDYPGEAHWSPVVAASHWHDLYLARPGATATPGEQSVAETGNPSTIIQELTDAGVTATSVGDGPFDNLESQSFWLTATPDNYYISAMTMMAPSPDWFAAIRMPMCDFTEGKWRQTFKVDSKLWDAGTDSGVSFRSDDVVTSPQGTIQQITERTGDRRYPFYDNSGRTMPAQASWVFEYYGIVEEATTTKTTRRRSRDSRSRRTRRTRRSRRSPKTTTTTTKKERRRRNRRSRRAPATTEAARRRRSRN